MKKENVSFSEDVLNSMDNFVDRIFYLMKFDKFIEYSNSISAYQVIKYNEHCVANNINSKCPITGRQLGKSIKNLDDGRLRWLIALMRLTVKELKKHKIKLDSENVHRLPSFHYDDVNDEVTRMLNEEDKPKDERTKVTNGPTSKHFGVIEADYRKRNPIIKGKGKTNGYWYLTKLGIDFLIDRVALPEEVWTLNDQVVWTSKKTKKFKDCKTVSYEERQKYRKTYF